MKIVMYLAALLGGLVFTTGMLAWILATSTAVTPGAVLLAALAPTAFVGSAWLLAAARLREREVAPTEGTPAAFWWQRSAFLLVGLGTLSVLVHVLTCADSPFPSLVLLVSGFVVAVLGSATGAWLAGRRRANRLSEALRMPTADRLQTEIACLIAVGSQAIFWISLLAGAPSRPAGNTGQLVYHLLGNTQLALYATGVAALICGAYLRDQILHDARVNRDQTALLRRVIGGSAPLPDNEELRRQTLRYAVALPYQSFFRLLVIPLFFLAQALQYYVGNVRGEGSLFNQLIAIVLAVALILSTVHYLRWGRAARRFVRGQLQGPSVGGARD